MLEGKKGKNDKEDSKQQQENDTDKDNISAEKGGET